MKGHIRATGKGRYKLWIELPRVKGKRQREIVASTAQRKKRKPSWLNVSPRSKAGIIRAQVR